MSAENFKEIAQSEITSVNASPASPEQTPGSVGNEVKKSRGRPKGYSPKKALEAQALEEVKPIPLVNEDEAKIFSDLISAVCNMFIKKEYKDILKFTSEEFLGITRPLTQLKAYYMPSFGGIYVVWASFIGSASALGFAKYNIIKSIMDAEKEKKKNADTTGSTTSDATGKPGEIITVPGAVAVDPAIGKENNTDNGDKGNG